MNAIRCLLLLLAATRATSAEWHVAITGADTAAGTVAAPFRTIQHAADIAQPGDVVTVHAGIYRERINPPRGGTSDAQRITYQAASGEQVEIRGSEVVKGWTQVAGGVWKVAIPNAFFGGFNPYSDLIHGDWFNPMKRPHHTGAVYLDGHWLVEAATLEAVMGPMGAEGLWSAQVDDANTTIHAQFRGVDPNQGRVEINVRRTVFYPDRPGRNFITVRGFALRHAATPWAPPTAEQIGLIGTHWSRGWIIEGNDISHSVCSGITLGKHGDAFDNTSADSAEGYVKTIERAHAHAIAWNRENVGSHIIRNNTIAHCEQTGICGSLGAVFSTISGNTIHDIHVRRLFTGAEMGGIKIHAAIDLTISGNHIHHTIRAVWLDWMAQGTRVSGNIFHDNHAEDLFVEVDHGPFLVDDNLFLSATSVSDWSEGGAYVHNLFTGRFICRLPQSRQTPCHPAHATTVAALASISGGDDRFFNNVFVGTVESPASSRAGLGVYDAVKTPLLTGGNVYYRFARPHAQEAGQVVRPDLDPGVRIEQEGKVLRLHLTLDASVLHPGTALVTTERLGTTLVSKQGYVAPDGSPLAIDRDLLGRERDLRHPTAGPFERPGLGAQTITLR